MGYVTDTASLVLVHGRFAPVRSATGTLTALASAEDDRGQYSWRPARSSSDCAISRQARPRIV
jgi:hypothetical protein